MTRFHTVKLCVAIATLVGTTGAGHALDEATLIKLGEAEYMRNCASCHGATAKGDGPVAEVLSTGPSDLTMISAEFSGIFPADHIYQVIDGQQMISPHGDRQMPVWGPRYWTSASETAGGLPHDVDAQALVHGRIEALVSYLKSIQAN